MFVGLKRGFRSLASLILLVNVVGELQPKRTLAASRGVFAAARLSCSVIVSVTGIYLFSFSISYSCDFSDTVTCIVFQFLFPIQLDILHKICTSESKTQNR